MSRNYDRQLTIFSPEGRLFQVEYAFKAAKMTPHTGVGWKGAGIAALIGSKKVGDKLINQAAVSNIEIVNKRICMMTLGRASDCRSSVSKAREFAHEFYYKNGHEISTGFLAKKLADHFQLYTQHAYRRCFGCEVIFAGCDDDGEGPELYHIVPAGQVFGYSAVSIGAKKTSVLNYLDKQFKDYKEPKSAELLIEESILALMQGTSSDYKAHELEIVIVDSKGKIRKLTEKEIDERLTAISDRD